MPFSQFKSIGQVIKQYPVRYTQERFLPEADIEPPLLFLENIVLVLERQPDYDSEFFLREGFIFPFLQQAWKPYEQLTLWSHQELFYDDILSGEPDYMISTWCDEVIDRWVGTSLLAVVVAKTKREDFEEGWGQCLAEMIACQKLNQDAQKIVYGMVSIGTNWQFGKITQNIFTKHPFSFSITESQRILGILDYIFAECNKQIKK